MVLLLLDQFYYIEQDGNGLNNDEERDINQASIA